MSEAVECDPCSQKVPHLRAYFPAAKQAFDNAASAAKANTLNNTLATTPEAEAKLAAKANSDAEKAGLSAAGMFLAERLHTKHDLGISLYKWARSFPLAPGVAMNLAMTVANRDTYVCPGCGGRAAVQNDGATPMASAPVSAKGLEERDLRPQAVAAVDKETAQAPAVRAPSPTGGAPEFADAAD